MPFGLRSGRPVWPPAFAYDEERGCGVMELKKDWEEFEEEEEEEEEEWEEEDEDEEDWD